MTHFKHALSLCGLKTHEAAEYLGLSNDMVRSMTSGRRRVPDETWRAMSELWKAIGAASASIPEPSKGVASAKAFLEAIADRPPLT